jgi:hypothetical protein
MLMVFDHNKNGANREQSNRMARKSVGATFDSLLCRLVLKDGVNIDRTHWKKADADAQNKIIGQLMWDSFQGTAQIRKEKTLR